MNMKEERLAAAAMCARAAEALGVVIERSRAPSAAPEAREALQDLCRLFSYMDLYNHTLATGSPSDIEKWRRDGARIRAEASETLHKLLDACLPSLGTEHRLDELQQGARADRQRRADREPEVERGLDHGAG